jgi:hypothetical protein
MNKTIQETIKEYRQIHPKATAKELEAVIKAYTVEETAEMAKAGKFR